MVHHPAPRSQWLAIAFLGAAIFALLLVRSHKRHLPPSPVQPSPVFVAVEGTVKEPGIILLQGPEVTIGRAIQQAGGLRNFNSQTISEDLAMRSVGSGQVVQVADSGQGPVEICVKAMSAPARLTLGERLNVNESSAGDLMLVPQMKPGFAEAIVDRRSSKRWQTLEELEEIPGVGPRTVERWSSYLTVKEPYQVHEVTPRRTKTHE